MTDSGNSRTEPSVTSVSPFTTMLRAALIPSAVVSVITVVVFWILRGNAGGLSALFGAALALGFFTSGLMVMTKLRALDPALLMAAGLAVFFGQVLVLGIALAVATGVDSLDGPATGITVAIVVIAWQIFQVIGFRRTRQFVFDPDAGDSSTEMNDLQGEATGADSGDALAHPESSKR